MQSLAIKLPTFSTVNKEPIWLTKSSSPNFTLPTQRTDFQNHGYCKRSGYKNKNGVQSSQFWTNNNEQLHYPIQNETSKNRRKTRQGEISLSMCYENAPSWESNYKHDFREIYTLPINRSKTFHNLRESSNSGIFSADPQNTFLPLTTYNTQYQKWNIKEIPRIPTLPTRFLITHHNDFQFRPQLNTSNKLQNIPKLQTTSTIFPNNDCMSSNNERLNKPFVKQTCYSVDYQAPSHNYELSSNDSIIRPRDHDGLICSTDDNPNAADKSKACSKSVYTDDFTVKPMPNLDQIRRYNVGSMTYHCDQAMRGKLMNYVDHPKNMFSTIDR